MNPIWLIGIVAIGVAGCAPADKMTAPAGQPPAASNAAPAEKSVTRQAVEGFTGKTSVDAGDRTKAKIKAFETQRQQNFEEIPP
ncbi:MAG: hypothetical protein PHW60_02210 [Kiritimatiellae bacterium]|nr:hypothetical protein [Kiritimatiellia bacterium]